MKIADIVGARPQFIKLAPVLRAIDSYNQDNPDQQIEEILIHTGQHYDYEMSQVFFRELGLKTPDYNLGVGSGTHGFQTGEMLKCIEGVLIKEKPDLVMVYGDTNTTLAGALAAAKLEIPVAHVEAGLRSFNRHMPEETNRVVTDHIASILFCPTETSARNLQREGMSEGVHIVGDVMYDAVLQYCEIAKSKSVILNNIGIMPKEYALATVHRAENTDNPRHLENIVLGLKEIASRGLHIIFPMHPRTRNALFSCDSHLPSSTFFHIIEPVAYLDMLILEKHARVILTDSGGVQKEAFFFRVPCLTLRNETEWLETTESGWNTIVGTETRRIVRLALNIEPGSSDIFPYGNGNAANRIVKCISEERLLENQES